MAKNFTQFTEINGTVADGGNDRTTTLTETQTKENVFVVGYADTNPGGERRFTLQSILLACDPIDIGLGNVTNESKTTMFTRPTFTPDATVPEEDGPATACIVDGNLIVNGGITYTGDVITEEQVRVQTAQLYASNNGSLIPLLVNQLEVGNDTNETPDIVQINSGPELALNINKFGRMGVGRPADADNEHQLVIGHIDGQPTDNHTVVIYGGLSADYLNGYNPEVELGKLSTIDSYAKNFTKLDEVSSILQMQYNAGDNTVLVKKGYDLLEDGDDYKKIPAIALDLADSNYGDQRSAWLIENDLDILPGPGDRLYGTWDASREKLLGIESLADQTGPNSFSIRLNEVPDGEFNGDADTTKVLMTSAERVRLAEYDGQTETGIRTVSYELYTGDAGETLDGSTIVQAYNSNNPNHWSLTDDNEYHGVLNLREQGLEGVKSRSYNSVQNVTNDGGEPIHVLEDGDAILNEVSVQTLSADTIYATNRVQVKDSEDQKWNGITTTIDVGGYVLTFVDGILIKKTPVDDPTGGTQFPAD